MSVSYINSITGLSNVDLIHSILTGLSMINFVRYILQGVCKRLCKYDPFILYKVYINLNENHQLWRKVLTALFTPIHWKYYAPVNVARVMG